VYSIILFSRFSETSLPLCSGITSIDLTNLMAGLLNLGSGPNYDNLIKEGYSRYLGFQTSITFPYPLIMA
jgi:hypothetical protein